MAKGLAERLLAILTVEMRALEIAVAENKPRKAVAAAIGDEAAGPVRDGTGAKGRIEAIGVMTRTLEKLLELRRLEALSADGDHPEDAAETLRLRGELMRRLKALDARRRAGATLFGLPPAMAGMAPA